MTALALLLPPALAQDKTIDPPELQKARRGPEEARRARLPRDKPIHVYAYNLDYHFPKDFAEKVMKGNNKWNEKMREYSHKTRTGIHRADDRERAGASS